MRKLICLHKHPPKCHIMNSDYIMYEIKMHYFCHEYSKVCTRGSVHKSTI